MNNNDVLFNLLISENKDNYFLGLALLKNKSITEKINYFEKLAIHYNYQAPMRNNHNVFLDISEILREN